MSLLLLFASSTSASSDGSYIVSGRATPDPRFDGVKWTTMLLEEAPSRTGAWTQIDSFTLSPQDTDPTDPQPREFTTDNATLAAGWYRTTFVDGQGHTEPTRSVFYGLHIMPSLDDVAALLRTRLVDDGGKPLATFTDTSSPSRAQVDAFIAGAIRRVRLKVGSVQPELADDAREVVALYAAARAELTLWPEQVPSEQSPYRELKTLADEALADLDVEVEEVAGGGEPGPADDHARPLGLFPAASVQWDREPL